MALKLADWARQNNISPGYARQLFNQGKLPNARQISPRIVLVEEPDSSPQKGKTAIYSRVSSQDQKTALTNQTANITKWATQNEYSIDIITEEIGSGLNDNRKKWLTLLGDPEITNIIVEHRERATRFGFNQIQTILKAQNRQIIVVNNQELENDLVRDMTEILTSFCARLYGQRGAKARAQKALEASKNE